MDIEAMKARVAELEAKDELTPEETEELAELKVKLEPIPAEPVAPEAAPEAPAETPDTLNIG